MNIAITNFWHGAFEGDFLVNFLRLAIPSGYTVVSDVTSADVVLTSVFGSEPTPRDRTIKFIWENIRPNMTECRFSFSSDYDHYSGANYYLPYWFTAIRWPDFVYDTVVNPRFNHGFEPPVDLNLLLRKRTWNGVRRSFCAFVANNINPIRVNLYSAIAAIDRIDGFGGGFRNPLLASKLDTLRNYDFCLCPENSTYPGYITEKPIHAYASDCVPLYYGDLSRDRYFNKSALLNHFDELDSERFASQVLTARIDDAVYRALYEQPLLTRRPEIAGAIAFFRYAVEVIRATSSRA
jgi:hypothetical protein